MTTDFTNNNSTINITGGCIPNKIDSPLDMRTRVNNYSDIQSIPNPFIGMKIIVLQDETHSNGMREYVVKSLKENDLGMANAKIDEVDLVKDFTDMLKTLVVIDGVVTLDDTRTQNLTIDADITINFPTNLEFKRITLNLVSISENPVIITFIQNTESKRVKIAANSYNVFEIDLNGDNSIIRKISDIDAELTETEINEGILN